MSEIIIHCDSCKRIIARRLAMVVRSQHPVEIDQEIKCQNKDCGLINVVHLGVAGVIVKVKLSSNQTN